LSTPFGWNIRLPGRIEAPLHLAGNVLFYSPKWKTAGIAKAAFYTDSLSPLRFSLLPDLAAWSFPLVVDFDAKVLLDQQVRNTEDQGCKGRGSLFL
jgi:hypothetical protein